MFNEAFVGITRRLHCLSFLSRTILLLWAQINNGLFILCSEWYVNSLFCPLKNIYNRYVLSDYFQARDQVMNTMEAMARAQRSNKQSRLRWGRSSPMTYNNELKVSGRKSPLKDEISTVLFFFFCTGSLWQWISDLGHSVLDQQPGNHLKPFYRQGI